MGVEGTPYVSNAPIPSEVGRSSAPIPAGAVEPPAPVEDAPRPREARQSQSPLDSVRHSFLAVAWVTVVVELLALFVYGAWLVFFAVGAGNGRTHHGRNIFVTIESLFGVLASLVVLSFGLGLFASTGERAPKMRLRAMRWYTAARVAMVVIVLAIIGAALFPAWRGVLGVHLIPTGLELHALSFLPGGASTSLVQRDVQSEGNEGIGLVLVFVVILFLFILFAIAAMFFVVFVAVMWFVSFLFSVWFMKELHRVRRYAQVSTIEMEQV